MKVILAGLAILPLAVFAAPSHADTAVLTPQSPIEVPGGSGHFDFIQFDGETHRLLACHPGSKNLVVLDVKSGKVTTIDTGEVNGVGIDTADNKYFAAGGNQDVVVIDRATLAKVADIPTQGPCDDVVYDSASGKVYVCNDDGTQDWVIDPKTNTIAGSVAIAGAPEVVKYDPKTDKLYQNIKPTDQVQVIDPATNKVTATWSTAPVDSPHGLAIDAKHGRVFTAGKNGKLAEIDVNRGSVISSCDIAKGVDEIAFDPSTKQIYCGCSGAISVVKVSKKGLTPIADVPITAKSHNVAVDPETQSVWIAYNNENGSYLQEYRHAEVAGK
jgi:DNA-binding beta-propeller fold protein YncE